MIKIFILFNGEINLSFKEIFDYLNNQTSLEESVKKIKTNSRRYAKRQLTYFNSNKSINWFENQYDIKNIFRLIESKRITQQLT